MIASMTGYARVDVEQPWGILTWECRSVNHRYLEMVFRIPEKFRSLEMKWRQQLGKQLSRGKIDLSLKYQLNNDIAASSLQVNQALVKSLSQQAIELAPLFPQSKTQLMDVLQFPGVMQSQEVDQESIIDAATQGLLQLLEKLKETRVSEGRVLNDFFASHLDKMSIYVTEVQGHLPNMLGQAQQRMRDRFAELQLEVDVSRLEQEMVWLAQKLDVAEEIERLNLHINEFRQVLIKGGVIGRRLDFLSQELNREANTLASKSIDATVTHLAVELKVLIEQIREQVQNIE